jgi:excisionase family DNA binding protein
LQYPSGHGLELVCDLSLLGDGDLVRECRKPFEELVVCAPQGEGTPLELDEFDRKSVKVWKFGVCGHGGMFGQTQRISHRARVTNPRAERLLKAAELAELLRCSASTIVDWAERGDLPAFKLGRVPALHPSHAV